jgi:D-amino-acid dehydrogenase
MHADRMMLLFLTARAAREELELLSRAPSVSRSGLSIISGADAREREPIISERVAAAIELPTERHVRPETLVTGLVAALRSSGAQISEDSPVIELRRQSDSWKVATATNEIEAGKVVVAAGWETPRLLSQRGIRILVQPGVGYTLTSSQPSRPISRALYFSEARITCVPYQDAVRLASFLGLGSSDTATHGRELDRILDTARIYVSSIDPKRDWTRWAAVRPMSADGLPYIGGVPGHDGLFVSTGHGMLGMTLAPSTGYALASAMTAPDRKAPDLRSFRLNRS